MSYGLMMIIPYSLQLNDFNKLDYSTQEWVFFIVQSEVTRVNDENLKKGAKTQFCGENAARMAKKAHLARRQKKTLREHLILALNTAVDNPKLEKYAEQNGIDCKKKNYGALLASALIVQAIKGNTPAARLIYEVMGEIGAQKLEITGKDGKPLDATPKVQIYLPDNHRG